MLFLQDLVSLSKRVCPNIYLNESKTKSAQSRLNPGPSKCYDWRAPWSGRSNHHTMTPLKGFLSGFYLDCIAASTLYLPSPWLIHMFYRAAFCTSVYCLVVEQSCSAVLKPVKTSNIIQRKGKHINKHWEWYWYCYSFLLSLKTSVLMLLCNTKRSSSPTRAPSYSQSFLESLYRENKTG